MIYMEKSFLKEGNRYIKNNNIEELKKCCKQIYHFDNDYQLNKTFFFQRFFNNICIFGDKEMIILFMIFYFELSLMDRLFLRQNFFYGKYLIRKNKKINDRWYNESILPLIKVT